MVTCIPLGVCSWNYRLAHEGATAVLNFATYSEQGSFEIEGTKFNVLKHGAFSGRWTLNDPVGVIYEARKASPFTRRFELGGAEGSWVLSAVSCLGQSMAFTGHQTDCRMEPVHCFTRRATIQGAFHDFRLVAFAFWLTALTWRRQHAAAAST